MLHVRQAPSSLNDGHTQGLGQSSGSLRAIMQRAGRATDKKHGHLNTTPPQAILPTNEHVFDEKHGLSTRRLSAGLLWLGRHAGLWPVFAARCRS